MTDAELDAIEARANAATAGPLSVGTDHLGEVFILTHATDVPSRSANVIFYQNARADIPALIAEVRQLRVRLARLARL